MTNQEHPITPPTELVQQWYETANNASEDVIVGVANRSAQWGADQELAACIKWVKKRDWTWTTDQLRAARRPKPLSEADQALEALDRIDQLPTAEDQRIIRRALERLKEMEGQGND